MPRPRGSGFRLAATLSAGPACAALLLSAGCGGSGIGKSPSGGSAAPLRSVTIAVAWPSPSTGSRALPESANSMVITVTDSLGFSESQTVNRPPAGSTLSTVTVSFFGLAPGNLTVTATAYSGNDATGDTVDTVTSTATISSGGTASVSLAFADVPFSGIQLTSAPPTPLAKGQSTTITVAGIDGKGHVITSAPSGQWASSNPAAATVSATGVVTAVAPGSSNITFTDAASGKTLTVKIVVTGFVSVSLNPAADQTVSKGGTLALTASATDALGAMTSSPAGAWATSNAAVASVDAKGVVTAVAPGAATITFTDGVFGLTASLKVTVPVVPIASISFSPLGNQTIVQGQTVTVTATGLDANNNVLAVSPPGTWASSKPSAATVNSSGQIVGVGLGQTTISFTDSVFGKSASITVVVLGGDSQVTIQ
jgi:uncharacterized protein YjdB